MKVSCTALLTFLTTASCVLLNHHVVQAEQQQERSDVCSDATDLIPIDDNTEWTGNLIDAAVVEGADALNTCTGIEGVANAWYRFQGTGTVVSVSTCTAATNFDSVLSVYTGTCDDLQCVDGNDDSFECTFSSLSAQVNFFAEADVVYHVRLHGFGQGFSAEYGLRIQEYTPPTALEFCQQRATLENFGSTCQCVDDPPNADPETIVALECTESCFTCRNPDFCFQYSFAEQIQVDQGGVPFFDSALDTQTVIGGPFDGSTITVAFLDCIGTEFDCGSCQIELNGEACNACTLIPSSGIDDAIDDSFGFETIEIDCTNIYPDVPVFTIDEIPIPPELEGTLLQGFAYDAFDGPQQCPSPGACEAADTLTVLPLDGNRLQGSIVGTTLPFSVACGFNPPGFVEPGVVYSLIGQGNGVEISTCFPDLTDFSTRISVLGGNCAYLQCIESNNYGFGEECSFGTKLSFFAEMDQVYYVVVHSWGDETGDFAIQAQQANVAMVECESNYLFIYEDSAKSQTCTCQAVGTSEATLSCINGCDYCTTDRSSCSLESLEFNIDSSGDLTSSTRILTYASGSLQGEELTITTYDCNYLYYGCTSCNVAVNGETCVSCSPVECDNFDPGLAIDCSNLSTGGAIFDTCAESPNVGDGTLQFFANDICLIDPLEACEARNLFDDCMCQETETGAMSTCPSCLYCNTDETVCAENSYGTLYDMMGQISGDVQSWTYTEGRTETVTFTNFYDGSGNCAVVVDGVACNTCTFNFECPEDDGFFDLYVECENIETGATFDRCDFDANQSGVLQIFNNDFFCSFDGIPDVFPTTSPYPTISPAVTPMPDPIDDNETGTPPLPTAKGKGVPSKGKGGSMPMTSSRSKGGMMMMGGKGGMMMMSYKGYRRELQMQRSYRLSMHYGNNKP